MAKLKTIIVPGNIYFITTTVVGNTKIFVEDKYCQIIIDNLKFYRKKYKFKLFGFVVMPDHLHLLILPKFVESVGSEEPTSTNVKDIPRYQKGLTSANGGKLRFAPVGLKELTFVYSMDIGSIKFVDVSSSQLVGAGLAKSVDAGSSEPAKAPNISDIMRDFKKYTAIQIIKQLKIDGREDILRIFHYYALKYHPNKNRRYQVWLDGFWSTNIYSDKFFHQKLDYIHNNPIKAGLVKDLADYPWSSYQNYYLNNHSLIKIDYWEG
jgi:REP element-mobilizing transposase RayT